MIPYNKKFVPHPFGLSNSGAICWFNSLLQSLLSCSSFNETLINNEHKYKSNRILSNYITILKHGLQSNQIRRFTGQNHAQIINIIRQQQAKSKSKVKFGSGQQDADEGLKLLIDAISDKTIVELFQIRYRGYIRCKSCDYRHQSRQDIGDPNFTIEIAMDIFDDIKEDKHADIIQKYVICHNEFIDGNYVCIQCNTKGNADKIAKLAMTPEVLILLFKKYTNQIKGKKVVVQAVKKDIKFPNRLEFNRGTLKYNLVSQCEHSGGLGGGHYWAISQRKTKEDELETFNLNDSSVGSATFGSTSNTYMLFYHYMS